MELSTVGVVIATYGEDRIWRELGQRAKASIESQTVRESEWIWKHGNTLAETRNKAAAELKSDWLIFLDADDVLHPQYIEKMLEGEGDIRQPSTLGFYEDGREDEFPVLIPEKPLIDGNYIVIGAMCRRDLFFEVGGFRDHSLYEDWDLWLRMEEAGATIGKCPEAIYKVFVKEGTRNFPDRKIQEIWYHGLRTAALSRRGLI